MHSIRRIFSVGTAALVLGAGLVAGSSGAAQAAASDCTQGRAGFTDIPDSLSGRGVAGAGALVVDFPTNVPYAVASYAMQTGNVGGREMGWGVLSTSSSLWGAGASGQVWMDVTNDNKQSWIQCGPFYVSSAGARITTPAYPTSNSASRAFRVCAMAAIPVRDTGITCTPWW
ncbi:hypothetical protein [Streptomyces phaeochromogenes]|uniref:Secreted protein n=1 Tax=Streptomyces phaeochromogenes TaxID=1923 RepID=A0ABZ1HU94_STRPH|nr:hypothetical protein [Streptomyces phaeochromogenes]WRZ35482.1 hypothetical protein OG931_50975 [Streptomyces phaeochromogenes]WSD20704.1 hypothetical protein OHB35_49805 [Streptomyces phaeochromogenes]WSJ02607.1 hypothetical protein OG437_02585 [Streptomyces phaeochromogenes]WSS98973.1 hypothetical protein OG478_48545 [Streptomyces phaeochromogenes]WSW11935.1 hypothetical protein OG277_02305 [Streptomyces phaeochromogenes]